MLKRRDMSRRVLKSPLSFKARRSERSVEGRGEKDRFEVSGFRFQVLSVKFPQENELFPQAQAAL